MLCLGHFVLLLDEEIVALNEQQKKKKWERINPKMERKQRNIAKNINLSLLITKIIMVDKSKTEKRRKKLI
jgi:hypothetical protein